MPLFVEMYFIYYSKQKNELFFPRGLFLSTVPPNFCLAVSLKTLKKLSASTVLTMVLVSLVFLCFYFFLIFFLVGSLVSSAQEMGVPTMRSTSSSESGR